MFAIRKFFKYLWGRKFKLVTDNAPLKHILSPDKSIPVLSAQRLQHWSYILQAYQFEIVHRSGSLLSHVDALSRLPCDEYAPDDLEVCSIAKDLPLNSSIISDETKKDSVLQHVLFQTKVGWPVVPKYLPEIVKPFFKFRDQLSLEKGCVLYNARVVIPASLQSKVLDILHEGHAGIVRMKMLARTSVWWQDLSRDIETKCDLCNSCSMVNFKRSHDYVPWPEAKSPFERVHIDFATLCSKHYFVFADSFSKWIHVQRMSSMRAIDVIVVLTTVFSIFGDPMSIISDNGPPFDSVEYVDFCTSRDIVVCHSPPYHPESNGFAERAVQIAKKSLEKLLLDSHNNTPDDNTCDLIVNKFLTSYRNTPTTTTLKAPNEVLLSFKPVTSLSRLLPNFRSESAKKSEFRDGESVVVKLSKNHPPVKGTIVRRLGPTRYLVSFEGVLRKPHINQMNHSYELVRCVNFTACDFVL
ncbi:uncharacterized protein K02A2.6-like [Thrips palmi]|uniref:RNA-directed DNA polymerase n=1 Tax=Thrips palmi TaxID=161013 RepID=A0A6P8ZPV5_THRPL|nr:uncharacterized protein K02A2.6-like [Thrips palmi]